MNVCQYSTLCSFDGGLAAALLLLGLVVTSPVAVAAFNGMSSGNFLIRKEELVINFLRVDSLLPIGCVTTA